MGGLPETAITFQFLLHVHTRIQLDTPMVARLSTNEHEWSMDAEGHLQFFEFVLSAFGKDISNVVSLVGDNCATSKAIATKVRVCLVGFHSHRFNLAISYILSPYDGFLLLSRMREFMTRLRTLVPAAKLRILTPLKDNLICIRDGARLSK